MHPRTSPGLRIEPSLPRARHPGSDMAPAIEALRAVGAALARNKADAARIGLNRAERELGRRTGGLAPRAEVLQSLLALRQAQAQLSQGRIDGAAAEIGRAIAALTRA